jgi:hypothetical protein
MHAKAAELATVPSWMPFAVQELSSCASVLVPVITICTAAVLTLATSVTYNVFNAAVLL